MTVLSSMTLTFGKYKGRSLHEVGRVDPTYVGWLKNKDVISFSNEELTKEFENLHKSLPAPTRQLTRRGSTRYMGEYDDIDVCPTSQSDHLCGDTPGFFG